MRLERIVFIGGISAARLLHPSGIVNAALYGCNIIAAFQLPTVHIVIPNLLQIGPGHTLQFGPTLIIQWHHNFGVAIADLV